MSIVLPGGVPTPPSELDENIKERKELEKAEQEEAEKKAKAEESEKARQLEEAKSLSNQLNGSRSEFAAPSGDGAGQVETVKDLAKEIREGQEIKKYEVMTDNAFDLPAMLIDLSAVEATQQIYYDGLQTFFYAPMKDEDRDKLPYGEDAGEEMHIYLRVANGSIMKCTSVGRRKELTRDLPEYVKIVFGDKAKVREIIRTPDGRYKQKKVGYSISTIPMNFVYWF